MSRLVFNPLTGRYEAGPSQVAGIGKTAFIPPNQMPNVGESVPEPIDDTSGSDLERIIAALTAGLGAGGGGGSRLSAGEKRRGYRQARQSAQQMRDYGTQAQQQYQNMLAALQQNLAAQQATGRGQIEQAYTDYMGSMTPSQAYSEAPIIQLTPEQQGLSAALGAYGAGTGQAQAVSAQQAEINRQMAELAKRSATQLNQEQERYLKALETAGAGSRASALQSLAQQGVAADLATQQQFGMAGLQEALAGQKSAAQIMSEAAATYGMPKKRRNRNPKK